MTVGMSSLLVLAAAVIEMQWGNAGLVSIEQTLVIWVSVAVLSAAGAAVEMIVRAYRMDENAQSMVWQVHRSLLMAIGPCLIVGVVLTVALHRLAGSIEADEAWKIQMLLPGIWSMVYALGLCNCLRHLPRWSFVAAGYFLLAGAAAFFVSASGATSIGWQMVLLFGVGQSLLAIALYWSLERVNG